MNLSAAVFYESLAELLKAGVPMSQAIASAGAAAGGQHSEQAPAWAAACSRGEGLAVTVHQGGGGHLEATLLEAGERSGRLPELCRLLATHARRSVAARRLATSRLLYPALLVHLALIALAVPVVVPRLMAGEGISLMWLLTGPLVLWAVAIAIALAARRASAELRARWLLLPGLRDTTHAWQAANTCTVLHAAAAAGLLVPQMLELAADAGGSQLIATALRREAGRAVSEGTALSVALGRAGLPAELSARLAIAEKAGSLDTTLDTLAAEWHERFGQRLDRLVQVTTATAYGLAVVLTAATVIILFARYMATIWGLANEAGA